MPAWKFWERLQRLNTKRREQNEEEHKRWVTGLLSEARSVTFALEVNRELPPTKEEVDRQRQGKQPKWAEINRVREKMLKRQEAHFKALETPYDFESYMGLPHVFDPPKIKTAEEFKGEDVQRTQIKQGVMGRLQALVDAGHGNASFADLTA